MGSLRVEPEPDIVSERKREMLPGAGGPKETEPALRSVPPNPAEEASGAPHGSGDAALLARFEWWSRAAGAAAALLGLAVLAGWWLGIEVLRSPLGQVSMKANTAACLVLLGVAVLLLGKTASPRQRLVRNALALVPLGVALVTLVEYFGGLNLRIDQILARDAGVLYTPAGRMAPHSAISFVFLGVAVLGIDWETRQGRRLSQLLALTTMLIAALALADYAVDFRPGVTSIAIHTIPGLLLLATGVLFARPDRGIMQILSSPFSGGKAARQVLPLAFAIPMVMATLHWVGQKAGVFGVEWGIAMMVTGITGLMAIAVAWNAAQLNRSDETHQHELVRAGRQLAERASLLDLAHDAIIVRDLEGRIVFWNRGAETTYVWSREDAAGKAIQGLLQARFPESRESADAALRSTGRWEGEIAHTTKDGRQVVVASRQSLQRDERGRPAAFLEINRDITDRKRAEEQLRDAALYARSLLEASLDPLVTISKDGRIMDVNRATELATGRERERLVGSDFSDYFTEPAKARASYRQVFEQGSVQDYPLAIRHASGRVIDVLYNATVFRTPEGEVAGVFAAARDVTERKRAEEQVRRLNETLEERVRQRTAELESSNKELESFTYSVSHDLRSPLRHVSGFSQLLREECGGELSAEASHYIAEIWDGTRRMGELVDDLLNLARVGRQELAVQVTGLDSIVHDVSGVLTAENPQRQVEWKIGALPFVECDPGLIRQVFANLLANAVKFTRPRPQAVIEIGTQDGNGETVVFVRDNGVGFSPKYAGKLFGVFQRLHRTEDFEGTGVGLATVQRIIQKHGGKVWAKAELDRGATFYFSLPKMAGESRTVSDREEAVHAG